MHATHRADASDSRASVRAWVSGAVRSVIRSREYPIGQREESLIIGIHQNASWPDAACRSVGIKSSDHVLAIEIPGEIAGRHGRIKRDIKVTSDM